MNKTELTILTIEMNPIDDIQHQLEESGCYESEIEMMKAAGTYDAFVCKFTIPSTGVISARR